MARKGLVSRCPVCDSGMTVSELTCESCGTSVRGRFPVPDLCRLPDELYQFLVVFIKNRGVIRDVEKELGISYPTVRSRLDMVLAALGFGEQIPGSDSGQVIEMLERGEISAEEAEKLLRGEGEEKQE
ncbi:DUF2089 domain-containing protein [candidate division WOR-3 bacterium]|nr:DUF2089 domain-containing protein [candidate division WOR-3 bacterium]